MIMCKWCDKDITHKLCRTVCCVCRSAVSAASEIRYNYGAEQTNEWCEWLAYNGNSHRYLARTRRPSVVVGRPCPSFDAACIGNSGHSRPRPEQIKQIHCARWHSFYFLFFRSSPPMDIHIAISRARTLLSLAYAGAHALELKWRYLLLNGNLFGRRFLCISRSLCSWARAICSMCFGSSNEALKWSDAIRASGIDW